MEILGALLIALVVIMFLYEVARRVALPYPALFVVGGVVLGLLPGIPHIALEPELVLLVFLPPLLFGAAFETPIRDLRANLWPIARLAVGLVLVTMVAVAAVAQALVPGMGWAAAFALGAIVAPTDALAAVAVFRRLGVPRVVTTLIEGEALFNDATALIAYRAAVIAAMGTLVLQDAAIGFVVAGAGGVLLGYVAGRVLAEVVRRVDDPPVEVVLSLVVPFLVFLPAEQLGLSGVLAVVTAGLVIGRRLGTILSADSRQTWLTTWRMVGFVLNGLAFVLIGQALPDALREQGATAPGEALGVAAAISLVVIGVRFGWVLLASMLPNSPRRPVRPARRRAVVAADRARGLERAPGRGVARGGPGPAGDVPGAEPDPPRDVRRDPGHPRRPGPHPSARDPLGPLGRAGGRRQRARARARRGLRGRPGGDRGPATQVARPPAAARPDGGGDP